MNFLKRDFLVREPLLVAILVLIAILSSALTHAYSQAYDRRRAVLGVQWFERGKQALQTRQPTTAVEDFRTALLYDPRNWDFSVHLADALMAAGHAEQALNYYLSLWQTNPMNGRVNLQLARLYAGKNDTINAERYFNGAVFGDWPENTGENRRTASLELVQYYLDHHDFGHAESQLILLAGNLTEDPQLHVRVGDLFNRVGDDQRALAQYQFAMQLDPTYLPAIQGAGEAAFRIGDYRATESYMDRALRLDASNDQAKKLLNVVQTALVLDPYQQGLRESEKMRRTLRIFALVGNRLSSCRDSTVANSYVAPLQERWRQLKIIANTRYLTQHPDDLDTLLDFAISAEKQVQSNCGEPGAEDSALLAIAQQKKSSDQ